MLLHHLVAHLKKLRTPSRQDSELSNLPRGTVKLQCKIFGNIWDADLFWLGAGWYKDSILYVDIF